MLNITPVRNFKRNNLLNFKGIKLSNVNSNYNNLKPLARDTVSFKGEEQLNESLFEAFQNLPICREIYENGKLVESDLRKLLEKMVKPYLYDEETNPDGIVQGVETRVKGPNSLREKAAKKFAWAVHNDTSKIFDPEKIDDVKKNCGDIVGGRIILRRPTQNETSKIINSLIELIKKGKLKITRIENYISENGDKEKEYFNKDDLERLKKAVNRAMGTDIQVIENKKTTGYMALHLDIDLSDPDYKRKNDNYQGEIQIVGYDVSKLKDVEDLCYKLKGKNKIKGGHSAYEPFVTYFNKYMSSDIPDNLKQGFETFIKYNHKFIKSPETPSSIKKQLETYFDNFYDFINNHQILDEDKQTVMTYLEYLREFLNSPDKPDVKQEFDTYTQKAYNLQRLKDPSDNITITSDGEVQYVFPTPEDCKVKNLPPELDFNNLANLKRICDKAYTLMEE